MSHLIVSDIIMQNNDAQPGWVRGPQPALNENAIQVVDSCLALNAMPTPFAREEVVAQAFDIVVRKRDFSKVGYSYKKLVSDTLDIFEILFHYNLYKNRISIKTTNLREFEYSECNEIAEESNGNSRKTAGKKISYFKKALIEAGHNETIYFVVLDDQMVLAATSDKTVFYTTSRLDINKGIRDYDPQNGKFGFPRPNGSEFFGETPVSLADREDDFFEFMRHFFEENRQILADTPIGRYFAQVYDNDYGKPQRFTATLAVLKDVDGQDVVYPLKGGTIHIKYNTDVKPAELIRRDVVNLRYNINKKRFVTMGDNALNQLLPLDMTALARLDNPLLSQGDLIRKPGKVEIAKDAAQSKVEDIDKNSVPKFDLGIYPFFRYPKEFITPEFETYNIILVYKYTGSIPENALELRFWRVDKNEQGKQVLVEIPEGDVTDRKRRQVYYADRRVRTEERSSDQNHRTVHYTLYGTNFDYIEVIFNAPKSASGVLIPKFTEITKVERNKMTFAVDFGTTSTHVACNTESAFRTEPESMVFLHGNPDTTNIYSIYKYERYFLKNDPEQIGKEIDDLVDYIQNEFVPSSFDGDVYKFPMRTAVSCRTKSVSKKEDLILFGDANIATTYEKEPPRGNNVFVPNIKWSVSQNNLTSVFIHQIVKMCVCKAISEGYGKDQIEFVKFFPLSIGSTKDTINKAWADACARYGIKTDGKVQNLFSYTESLAPYYADKPEKAKCAVSIDIGGGSVDFAMFRDGVPQLVSSVLFGCDVLWGGGKNLSATDKTNPIFLAFIDTMRERAANDPDTREVLSRMIGVDASNIEAYESAKKSGTNYSSADIINFWLGNKLFGFADNDQIKTEYKAAFTSHLYAILYHIAQVMKTKEMPLPNAISFSGNGSKYIDYIGEEMVKIIASSAFGLVYAGDTGEVSATGASRASLAIAGADEDTSFKHDEFIRDLIIKLPTAELPGKERTAVGGLKIKVKAGKDFVDPETEVYYGEMLEDHNTFMAKKREDLVGKDDILNLPRLNEDFVESICKNIDLMETGLLNLLTSVNLQADFAYMDKDTCRTTLKDCLETNEDTSVLGTSDKIQSSLFFSPIRKLLFDIEERIRVRIANSN